jgi:hypothetical protein
MYLFSRAILDADNLPLFIDIIDSSSFPILAFIQHLILRFMDRSLDDALLEKIHYCPNLRGIEVRISDLGLGGDIGDVYQSLETHLPLWASLTFTIPFQSHPLGFPARRT